MDRLKFIEVFSLNGFSYKSLQTRAALRIVFEFPITPAGLQVA